MNQKTKTIIWIIAFIIFIGVSVFAYQTLSGSYKPENTPQISGSREAEENAAEGNKRMPAPDFTVLDTQGNPVKLSDFKGKPVVLNFWASWCPPCKSEMPHFNEVYSDVKDDVVFMIVDLTDGQRETKEKAQNYVKSQGFSFPVYFDTEQEAGYLYQVSSIPTTLFIDKEGMIVAGYQGAIEKKTLVSGIEKIK